MGMFVNPNAAAFQCAVNSEVYIDKTGLLEYTNKVLGTNARFICNSRPRRFGKSVCKFCSNGTPILKLAVHPF